MKKSLVIDDKEAFFIAAATPIFNSLFNEFYGFLDKLVCDTDMTYSEMRKYIIAMANRDVIIIHHSWKSCLDSKEEFDFSAINHVRVTSGNPSFGQINAAAASVTTVDSAITLLNFLRNREERVPNEISKEALDKVVKLYTFAGYYYVIKDAYDVSVWENGCIDLDEKKNLHIKYPDPLYPKLKNIGVTRLQQNVSLFGLHSYELLQKDFSLREKFLDNKSKKLKLRGIKTLQITNGEIKLSFEKCNISITQADIINEAAMMVYYPFFEDIPLKKIGNMTLDDVLVLFGKLQQLVEQVLKERPKKAEVKTVTDLEDFAYRIPVDAVRTYLHETTKISNNQINHFLKISESCDGLKRIDLWARPLMKVDNYYFLPLLPINAPNILYLIDVWLDAGGYDLEKRGKLFERYIKDLVKKSLDERFTYEIPNKNKFFADKRIYEEIDFILILKEVILVAEVKCIKYPFGPRDYYNSLQRLTEGADQIIRKVQFLKENAAILVDDLGKINEKELIPVVITNYPSFSGLKIKNIPVIDFFILDGYINSGKLEQTKIEWKDKSQMNLVDKIKKVYYSNEEEFNRNLKEYMTYPTPVEDILPKLSLHENKITLDDVKPQIYMQEVIMKS
ncbi:hypothetical protein EOL99_03595 [Candidatus Falkowbacteria bacterium]|nr:hypothetical protein [Candidatus Falkowbacteria bacterium]